MLEIGPIIRATMRNRVGAILVALQIALTMTIVINALFMINVRENMVNRISGVDEQNLFYLTSMGFSSDFNERETVGEDLRKIRSLPGVVNAIQTNTVPLLGSGWSRKLQLKAGPDVASVTAALYLVDPHGIDTMGIELIAGRNFVETDMQWIKAGNWPDSFIISKAMAEALFPDNWKTAVGSTVYIDSNELITIIGVVKTLQGPWVNSSGIERSMLSPNYMDFGTSRYLIRTEPDMRDLLISKIENMLVQNKGRVIRQIGTLDSNRERSYRRHNSIMTILNLVIIALVIITSLGIVGLTSFNINQRNKQIGIRRALGASKMKIISYFLQENLIITSVGLLIGVIGTIALNIWLVESFSLPSLDWFYIPVGMVFMSLLSILSVCFPVSKAVNISPAIATKGN
jgi:putative ABC transport system permease protein